MSENVRKKRLNKHLRFSKLQQGMREGKDFQTVADECGCSYKTVERDFWEWNDNGGFEKWVTTELMALHNAELSKEGRNDAYRVVADLKKRLINQKVSVESLSLSKHEEKIIIELWQPPDQGNDPVQPARRAEAVPPSTVQN